MDQRQCRVLLMWCFCITVLLGPSLQPALGQGEGGGAGGKSRTLKVGVLVATNSTIGKTALAAMDYAIQMINNDSTILLDTKLEVSIGNTNCSAFQGAAAGMNLMSEDVVAIIGPQASSVAHFVAHMGAATQVPLVSFSVTDPTLSEEQYRYFVRVTHSDATQMRAMAALIGLFGWRDVVAIYTDDDFGANAVAALGDALQTLGASIAYKAALDPSVTRDEVGAMLTQVSQLESRVIVVHLMPKLARDLFTLAIRLQMMGPQYVWLVTESVAAVLDMIFADDQFMQATQGVVGLRSYVVDTPQLDAFVSWWNEYTPYGLPGAGLLAQVNIYALFAHDAMWVVARALDNYLKEGQNVTFDFPPIVPPDAGGSTDMAKLNISRGGGQLLQHILNLSFTGVTGEIQFSERGDLVASQLEVVNMAKGLRVVGYWTDAAGFSIFPPTSDGNSTAISTTGAPSAAASKAFPLQSIIWPGGSSIAPRGWVVPKNGKPLTIGVPNKNGYKEFVSARVMNNITSYTGFCIDVFLNALAYLPYAVSYNFVSFGNGTITPSYDDLVNQVEEKTYDAVVGDVTITTKRTKIVDFTQPYVASGLVVVVPTKKGGGSHAWSFMRPFTLTMWLTTGAFFLLTGVVLWMLEHKKNRDFRGRPKKQVVTTLWFIFSTLFFAQREKVKSTLGRAVLIIWLFVVLIITSSYTASLTSILTVQQLTPTIQGISDLVTTSVPIGYQRGSFVFDYLRNLGVPDERLLPLDNMMGYADALRKGPKNGGVGAVVDELPYVQLFLSSECDFAIAGQEFTKSGWGFAFPKGSELAIDMSTAILSLAETGKLQQIHDLWLSGRACNTEFDVSSNELGLTTFWGLFLITGSASLFCIILYYLRLMCQHQKVFKRQLIDESDGPSIRRSDRSSFFRSFMAFIEESEVVDEKKLGSKKSKKVKVKRPSLGISSNGLRDPEEVRDAELPRNDIIVS